MPSLLLLFVAADVFIGGDYGGGGGRGGGGLGERERQGSEGLGDYVCA